MAGEDNNDIIMRNAYASVSHKNVHKIHFFFCSPEHACGDFLLSDLENYAQ